MQTTTKALGSLQRQRRRSKKNQLQIEKNPSLSLSLRLELGRSVFFASISMEWRTFLCVLFGARHASLKREATENVSVRARPAANGQRRRVFGPCCDVAVRQGRT